jgi:hypothetical protein
MPSLKNLFLISVTQRGITSIYLWPHVLTSTCLETKWCDQNLLCRNRSFSNIY